VTHTEKSAICFIHNLGFECKPNKLLYFCANLNLSFILATLKSKSIDAFKWNVFSQILNQLLILLINIFLVRLLTPQEFGLIAVPFVVYSFFRMVQDFGFTDVMIKEKGIDQKLFSTIYWTIVLGGILFSVINYLISPLLGLWTNNSVAIHINQWFSVILLIGSFSIGFEGMMRKELNFKFPFFIEFAANIIAGIAAICLAYYGWSWKALIMRFLIHIVLQLIFNFMYSKWRPGLSMEARLLKPHFQFASLNIAEQILNFLQRNIDTVLISRYIGTQPLGIYDRSYKLLLFPLQQVSGAFSKVMFPAFSKIQDEKAKVGQHFLKIAALISFVTFPMMLGLFAMCEDFVFVVFGQQWMEMVPILKLFSIISIFQSISTVSGSIFSATDNLKPLIKYSLYAKPVSIAAIFLAVVVHKDIYYVALYTTIVSFIMIFPLWRILAINLGIKSLDIWKVILPQLLLAMIMAAFVKITVYLCHGYTFSSFASLCCGVMSGVVSYTLLIKFTRNKAAIMAIDLLKSALTKVKTTQILS
jgi:O-antigen/teichoic acid export membrane protein